MENDIKFNSWEEIKEHLNDYAKRNGEDLDLIKEAYDYYGITLYMGTKQRDAFKKSYKEQRDLWIFNETQLRNQIRILSIKNYTLGLTYSERVRYLSTKKKLDTWHLF